MLYEVVNPIGEPAIAAAPAAPRLDYLEGKTVCEVSNAEFKAEESLTVVRQMLRDRYPTVNVVPFTEFPLAKVATWRGPIKEENEAMWRTALTEKGCDAVITGNGG